MSEIKWRVKGNNPQFLTLIPRNSETGCPLSHRDPPVPPRMMAFLFGSFFKLTNHEVAPPLPSPHIVVFLSGFLLPSKTEYQLQKSTPPKFQMVVFLLCFLLSSQNKVSTPKHTNTPANDHSSKIDSPFSSPIVLFKHHLFSRALAATFWRRIPQKTEWPRTRSTPSSFRMAVYLLGFLLTIPKTGVSTLNQQIDTPKTTPPFPPKPCAATASAGRRVLDLGAGGQSRRLLRRLQVPALPHLGPERAPRARLGGRRVGRTSRGNPGLVGVFLWETRRKPMGSFDGKQNAICLMGHFAVGHQ